MAGKEAEIFHKPTGVISAHNPENNKFYIAQCDAEGVLRVSGAISGQIAIETGHGKTLEDPAVGTITSATTTAAIAAGGAGIVTYVYGIVLLGLSSTLNTVTIKRGTTQVSPAYRMQGVGDAMFGITRQVPPDGWLFKSGENEAINIVTSTGEKVDYELNYWQE